ncbi:hypothetical protein ACQBAU_01440 [Propionibacteriaceae bacterium Y2011]|uniref:hypothetical protein n=1 Tax=Microlunatus sp. Y2014 TaxID=3418488 RepID=UPI003B455175
MTGTVVQQGSGGLSRRSLLAGAAVTTGVALAGLPVRAHADPASFTVLEAGTSWPDLSSYGVANQPMVYQSSLITAGEPDETKVRSAVSTKAAEGVTQLCLDIELWELNNLPQAEFEANAARYNQVMEWAHDEVPTMDLGWYRMLPRRDYWSPVTGDTAGWYADNARRQGMAAEVDSLYPSIYTFYANQTGWVTYAEANMDQACIYAKPAYVFLDPRYQASGPEDIRNTFIPRDYWRLQLETVYAHRQSSGSWIRGVVIWDSSAWDPNQGWWLETQDFMSDHGLV